jgi:DNA-binding sugar fermentation-stimulating protein
MAVDGFETHLVFMAMHTGIQFVKPHRALDRAFADACIKARGAGVTFHALRAEITPHRIQVTGAIPVELD